MAEMTAKWLKAHCKENSGYGTPSLNDKLYLHFQGFDRIQNLEAYTGLKSLFLEGNGLENLEGLSTCVKLKCLFAQQNMITGIPPSLPPSLSTLNLSNTNLSHVGNVAHLTELSTLQASGCKLKTLESISELAKCPQLTTLDVSQNDIDGDPEAFLALCASIPALACLYAQGNPIVSQVRQYRKRMIAAVPTLSYLDDRPVFPLERVCAEAWVVGGLEAEKNARARFKDAEVAKQKRDHAYLANLREKSRAKREALAEKGKKALADLGLSDSDGEYECEEEPPELVAARAKLAMYEARPGEEEPPELTAARTALAEERRSDEREAVVSTKPWQALGGPARGEPNTFDASTSNGPLDLLVGLSEMTQGQGRGGAAGRAAESAKGAQALETETTEAESDENAQPSTGDARVEKATPVAPVADDTCLDELD